MRELRLKYIINMVSDIKSRAKDDQQALTMAQEAVQKAFAKTELQIGGVERALLAMGRQGSRTAAQQADYLARLALRWIEVRRAAEGAAKAMQTAASIGAGATAGAYAADRMTRAPMDYSLRLAHMANTAYADRDVAGRLAGKRVLDAAINAAVRTGGGKRDDAAGALDSLIASGTVTIDQAIRLLPMLTKGSTASGAPAEQLGAIALRGMQSMDIGLDQIPEVLNMAMAAGQAGGFELKDMARWLPQAMAAGRMSGLRGTEGLRRILASMQANVTTAGTKDEAGNNLVNLLAKVNSKDTAVDLAKLGIDLPDELARQRERGVNSLDAFVGIVDSIASKDQEYMALKAKLDRGGTPAERTATMQSMADILQGKAVGQVVQDRQALMALIAEMNGRGYIQEVMGKTRTNTSAIGTSFDMISRETAFAREQAFNSAATAAQTAFDKVAPAVNAVYDGASGLATQFPLLSAGVVGATGALAIFAAALGGSGLIGILTGRAGNAGGVVGSVGTLLGGGAAAAGGALLRGGPWWARLGAASAAPVIGAGLDAWGTYTDPRLSAAGQARGYAQAGAGLAGGMGGVLAGAALGSMLGPIGTLLGGVAGGMGGSFGGKALLGRLWAEDPARDFTSLTDPRGAVAGLAPRVELGQGKIDVSVRVQDDRATASTSFADMAQVRLQGGSTNPAGY